MNDLHKLYHLGTYNYRSQMKYGPGETYDSDPPGRRYPPTAFDVAVDDVPPLPDRPLPASSHRYSCEPMSQEQMFSLLGTAYRLRREGGRHGTAPSAGGLFPIEFYVIALNVAGIERGVYHYRRQAGGLTYLSAQADELDFLPPVNEFAKESAFLVVMTADMTNLIRKYGPRGYRYALIECGHLGQNLSVACVEAGVGCCAIGGFFDEELNELLNLEPNEISLYTYSIGRL